MFTTLRSKIFAGFAAIITVNIVVTLWAVYNFSGIGERVNERVNRHYQTTSGSHYLSLIISSQYALFVGEGGDRDSIQKKYNSLKRELIREFPGWNRTTS